MHAAERLPACMRFISLSHPTKSAHTKGPVSLLPAARHASDVEFPPVSLDPIKGFDLTTHCHLARTAALLLLTCVAEYLPADEPTIDVPEQVEFFENRIRPVLVEHCYSCHSQEAETVQGGLYLDSKMGWQQGGDSGPAILPGQADASLLIQAMAYEEMEMPPKGRLGDDVLNDFKKWINDGAVDPRHERTVPTRPAVDYDTALEFWAFQSPQWSSPPTGSNRDATRPIGMIDRWLNHTLEQNDLRPNPPADPVTLIRRATLDLIGLPPQPEAIDRFVSDWQQDSKAAWRKLIDELLASEHYGERWGRHWLDVARYAEDQAHTFKARQYPRGYLYRDWVIQALNRDLPYDRFLTAQIAGDLTGTEEDRHERLAALGLFALGPVYYAENVEQAKARADEWDDRIDTLMRGVLGLTVSCARCHDHKFDPITMQDYYALAGVFASSEYQERPIVPSEVVVARQEKDRLAQQAQTAVERYLSETSRSIRPELIQTLPELAVAAWQFHLQQLREPAENDNEKNKQLDEFAKQNNLSVTPLRRLLELPTHLKNASSEEQQFFGDWPSLLSQEIVENEDADDILRQVRQMGVRWREQANDWLPLRETLIQQFGTNVAFLKDTDRSEVIPGLIPLGNLFDDSKNTPLDVALASDKFKAVASEQSLGVSRTRWAPRAEIAPGISFDFRKLGGNDRAFGSICNDAWHTDGGIRTTGQPAAANLPREEQGIGMHANALLTFDLNEIRSAGLIPQDQRMRLRVDRAGHNDDTAGRGDPSAYVAVIFSRPHRDKAVTDAILGGWINGEAAEVATDDFTYYFSSPLPPPLKADGRFITIDLPIPAEAQYFTLVTTGADGPDTNSISSDHTVFSGVRLEFDPLPELQVTAKDPDDIESNPESNLRAAAWVLSRLLDEGGVLSLPPAEAETFFQSDQKQEIERLRIAAAERKKEAEEVIILQAHSLKDDKPRDLPVYLQGNPAKQGEVVARSFPAIFTSGIREPFASSQSGRLELAQAITSPDNPLTARVMVNRVWAGHFGHGLVRTPSNFGELGDRPSHPELLDNLAIQFMQNNWSLKWLHREIMTSQAYQRSSGFDANGNEADPENRLLWKMNRRRLEIEPWRDTLLSVTGELDPAIGGPPLNLTDSNHRRRTIYSFISRHRLDEQLRLFDFPDPNITADKRSETTVPLQQLFVMNSDFMAQRSRAFARRLAERFPDDENERIQHAYRLCYGRFPSPDELEQVQGFLQSDTAPGESDRLTRLEQFCLALLSTNELMYVD